MLTVVKEPKGDVLQVMLVGEIGQEEVNFSQLSGTAPKKLVVNCKDVARINSSGVRAWLRHFQSLTDKGLPPVFQELSPALVTQLNLIKNFACGGSIESICAPYLCNDCKKEYAKTFATSEVISSKGKLAGGKCPHCGSSNTVFDEVEDYFRFLGV